jgi:pyruvate/2-oxoglutarate dehydrogenase complex dihydrolipoamide acyltransferase (E2) component
VEWAVDVGQAVQEGDVIALIETDKVTIDIKAKNSGVVSQRFGNV